MNAVLVLVLVVLALDGFRVRAVTPAVSDRGPGFVAAGAVLVAVALLADPVTEALDVSVASARAGAGLVAAVAGLARVVRGSGRPWPDDGRFVPLAFPVLLAPEAVALAAGFGVDRAPVTAGAVLLAVVLSATAGRLRVAPPVSAGLTRLGGAGMVAGAVAMVVDAVHRV